jgi:hypothetical protein
VTGLDTDPSKVQIAVSTGVGELTAPIDDSLTMVKRRRADVK